MDGVCTRFARSYAAARRKFILAAELAGHEVTTHAHTLRGPGGEELANDTVWIGDPDARRVLVVTAGTHGPELFCGSGAQIDAMLNWRADAYPGVALLLCHAVNPYGTGTTSISRGPCRRIPATTSFMMPSFPRRVARRR